MANLERLTRRNLPHWYVPGAAHFITYRLANTIPIAILERLQKGIDESRATKPSGMTAREYRARAHKQYFAQYDEYLDNNTDIAWLAKPAVAALIRENLYHHDGNKYHLLAYCVMPNHVHVLLQPLCSIELDDSNRDFAVGERVDIRSPLATVMHALKSYSAHEANKLLRLTGQFWQHESYDHWVRDDDELERIVNYIMANPVKANLVASPHDWYFCSTHDRYLQDGTISGWLPRG